MNLTARPPYGFAILVPALVGLAGVGLGILLLQTYGWVLFMGVPLVMAFLASFLLRRSHPVSLWACLGVSQLSLLLLLSGILLFGMDGLLCLLMALPLAFVLSLPGTLLGYFLARRVAANTARALPLLAVVFLPLFMAFEKTQEPAPAIHAVVSRVVIDAPIETVWNQVIAFDRITAPPAGVFRLGIAYPIQAKIEGAGAGAVRHCIFSTGPFVEPITRRDPPHALEFAVESNPVPLQEWSPWPHVAPPHLHGTFESQKGQFHLREEKGRTVLEGTTWYHQRIAPDWYWHRISDHLIHQIHFRVLDHIKERAEGRPIAQS